MPSTFAKNLSEQILRSFDIPLTDEEALQFERAIDFQKKFLNEADKDELAPLLFLECSGESKQLTDRSRKDNPRDSLKLTDLLRVLSRVQKRIYRNANRHRTITIESIEEASGDSNCDAVGKALNDFRVYIALELGPQYAELFESRFIQQKPLAKVCDELGISKNNYYLKIQTIMELFNDFLDDFAHPDIQENRIGARNDI